MAISRRTFLKAGVGVGAVGAVGVGYRQINKTKTQANIVIVGGGAAGIGIANQLGHYLDGATITVIETTWFPLVSTGPNVITCRCLYTSQ
ncbi:twin-arginine translocation signal domain-containing protein [Vibrio metschnikovii]